jgi:hypothetical protein
MNQGCIKKSVLSYLKAMRKYIFAVIAAGVMAGMGCRSDQSQNNSKSTGADSTFQDSSNRLDSFGGDGTAKSKKGTIKDSTVMGSPPEQN